MQTFKHSFMPFFYSGDVKNFADTNGAYWLIDLIASHYVAKKVFIKRLRSNEALRSLAFWTIKPHGDGCIVECREDAGLPVQSRQVVAYADFDFGENNLPVHLYCSIVPVDGKVAPRLFLPSEY